ncbi:NTP transferase domain-containing protein [Quadrisphaera sp. KR29]|uniref:NTP transferase domain-containing protein n=1 Tax=Quadrisphaera sp. KR29 TaxID=3461391 RepID=UPI0040444DC6
MPTSGGAQELRWGAVVPAGGRGSRMGGADKPALLLAGRPLLEHLLDGLPAGVPAAVVGPPRRLGLRVARPLLWCREDPPGGGPAAALAAGALALLAAGEGADDGDGAGGAGSAEGGPLDVVVVLPGDAPRAGLAASALLEALAASPGAASAVAVDGGGRRQVLVAAHRAGPLRERVARAAGAAGPAGLAGLAAARLLPGAAELVEVAVAPALLLDVDVPADLARLGRAREAGPA